MIGNDIVDLKQAALDFPDSYPDGKRHLRFLEKVFTVKEQDLILASEDKHQTVWLLWSMKEAAYKVNVQQFGKRFFNPKRLECELVSNEKGMVKIDSETYFTSSKITEDYVYTVATLKEESSFKTHFFKAKKLNYQLQSEVLKQQFLKTVAKNENYNLEALKIKKSEVGVPKVYRDLKRLPINFSLTHCGRFSGFVYL